MKKYVYYSLFLIITFACSKEQLPEVKDMDQLLDRYHGLGRFSGSVLIMKAGDVIYQQKVGLANYEAKKAFVKESLFKIALSDLEKAGIQEIHDQKSNSVQHLATGYLYHNYRGNGLELEAIPSPNVTGNEPSYVALSTQQLAQLVSNQMKDSISFSGYLENDGFSYAVRYSQAAQTTIIVLSNRRHPVADEMVSSLVAILQDQPYQLPLARKPYPINSTLLQDYTGRFALNEQVKFEVVAKQDCLYVYLGPNQVRLIPQSDNQFYMMESDAAMRFLRDTTGTVNRAVLLNGFIASDQVAYRIK